MSPAARAACAVVLAASAAGAVTAQTAAGSPGSQAPSSFELQYRSPFEGYRRFSDEKVGSWKDANDTVGRIGGWREYAREAQQPEAGTGAAPAGRDPHSGHEKH